MNLLYLCSLEFFGLRAQGLKHQKNAGIWGGVATDQVGNGGCLPQMHPDAPWRIIPLSIWFITLVKKSAHVMGEPLQKWFVARGLLASFYRRQWLAGW